MKNALNIFLSSTFDHDMLLTREAFRAELESIYNGVFNLYGINVYVKDLIFGIPLGTSPHKVLEYNLKEVETSDTFYCILSNNYGTLVKDFIKDDYIDTESEYYEIIQYALKNDLSVFEMEILFAISHNEIKKIFVTTGKQDINYKLKKYLLNSDNNWTYLSIKNLEEPFYFNLQKVLRNMVYSVLDLCEFPRMFGKNISEIEEKDKKKKIYKKYECNKLRYQVKNYKSLNAIYKYIECDTNSPLWIWGNGETGKTTLLLQFINLAKKKFPKHKVFSTFVCDHFELKYKMVPIILGLAQYSTIKIFEWFGFDFSEETLIERFVDFLNLPDFNKIKAIILIDGVDKIAYAFEDTMLKLLMLDNKLPNNIKIIFTINSVESLLPKNSYKIDLVDIEEVAYNIFVAEGKSLDYIKFKKFIQHFEEVENLQFIRLLTKIILKHIRFNNIDEILEKYTSVSSINELYNVYFEQAEILYGKNNVCYFFSYLLLSECLNINDLEDLIGDAEDLIGDVEDIIGNTVCIVIYFCDIFDISYLGDIIFNSINIKKRAKYRYSNFIEKNKIYLTNNLINCLWEKSLAGYGFIRCIKEVISFIICIEDTGKLIDYLSELIVSYTLYLHDNSELTRLLDLVDEQTIYNNWTHRIKTEERIDLSVGFCKILYERGAFKECAETLEYLSKKEQNDIHNKILMDFELAQVYEEFDMFEESQFFYMQVLQNIESDMGKEFGKIKANALFRFGRILADNNDPVKGLNILYESYACAVEIYGDENKNTSIILCTIGQMLVSRKFYRLAYPYFKKAIYNLEKELGTNDETVQEVYKILVYLSKRLLKLFDYAKWKKKLM